MENAPPEQKNDAPTNGALFRAVPIAFELGYLIAIPLLGLALLGRFADKLFGTSPWLLVTGIVTATVLSSRIVYRKISKFISS